jgi:Na+/proline symporter
MTIRGGLVSVIQTDVFSFFFTIVFIPMLFYFAYTFTSSSASFEKISIEDGQTALPPRFVFSLILLTMFTYIAAPWYGQKIFSARSERVAFTSVGVSAILVFLLYGFPVMAVYALNLHSVSLGNTETGLAYILGNLFTPGFRGFGYFVLFCAGATTLGGVWSAMTTMIITDLSSQKMDDSKGTSRSVKLSLLIAFISYFLSILFIDKVLDKLILANIPIAALSFGLLGGFYWKKTSSIGVSVSLVVGMIWGIFCYIYFGEAGMYTWYWSVYGIPAIFGSGILFSLLFPDTKISFHTV